MLNSAGMARAAPEKARQQANLMYCQNNLRNIGGLLQIYEAENTGYLPYSVGYWCNSKTAPTNANVSKWIWADTISLMTSNHAMQGTNVQNQAADYLDVFHDVDVPAMPRLPASRLEGPSSARKAAAGAQATVGYSVGY